MVSLPLQMLTVTLAIVALLILAVVDADGSLSVPLVIWFSLQAISLAMGAFWLRRRSVGRSIPPAISPFLLMLAISSFLWEPIARRLFAVGRPLEMLVMHALGAAVWGLALVSLWQKNQGISVLLSLFLAAFSLSAAHQLVVQGLAAMFALIAISWLTVRYWDQLSGRLRGQSTRSGHGFLVPGLAILFVLLAFTGGRHREFMATLNGFLPSSGGTGDSSPHARHGIGNGEMLVAGCENIQSFGPIDDAPFMTDDKPSLYDVFDDTYEEPVKPSSMDRSIALMPDKDMVKTEHMHTQVQKANREFSTARKPSGKQRNDVRNINSDALFYVSGRTPLHLRLELYDTFDGINWTAEPGPISSSEPPDMKMVKESGRDWLRLPDRSKNWEFLGPAETHAVKIIQLETNVIPAPLHLHGVHIADVDRPDLYKPGPQGLVRMDREKLAELVPIHLASRTVDHTKLVQEPWNGNEQRYQKVPESLRPELTRIAQEWGAGSPRGWTQIEAVICQLREHFHYDHEFREPDKATSPVLSFLTKSHRGPDYQFATAAAMLLRALNYSTRVVSGFYASPGNYDAASRHTPVRKSDVHFWTEVRLGNGAWVTLEPTPGYEVLLPPLGLWRTIELAAWRGAIAAWRRRLWLCASFLLVGCLLWFRHLIADNWFIINWRLCPRQRSAVQAWKILSYRLRVNGWKTTQGTTPRKQLNQIAAVLPEYSNTLQDFSSQLEREVFGRHLPFETDNGNRCSDRMLLLLSRSACRDLARHRDEKPTPPKFGHSSCTSSACLHRPTVSV